jgi:hypothetical protein
VLPSNNLVGKPAALDFAPKTGDSHPAARESERYGILQSERIRLGYLVIQRHQPAVSALDELMDSIRARMQRTISLFWLASMRAASLSIQSLTSRGSRTRN